MGFCVVCIARAPSFLSGLDFDDDSLTVCFSLACSNGTVMVSAVDEKGNWQAEKLTFGDIWYFPKGVAHAVQGLDDDNEFLLV